MSGRSPKRRLQDVLDAIIAIRRHEATATAHGLSREDAIVLDAVLRQMAIIGEAVAALPAEFTSRRPDIPWADVAGMRILLDHHYHRVDAEVVWNTVDDDIRPLQEAVVALLDT